jgi:SSS family solute:Na+ symporter
MATSGQWHILLPASDPDFPWTKYLGGTLCVSIFYCATNQFIVQRALAAKNEWHARMGVIFADYLKFLTPLVFVLPGMMAKSMLPNLEKADDVFPTLVQTLLPVGLVGLVMAALIAAVMSHISGVINSCTTILTVDFYLPFVNREASEAQAVRFGRIAGAVVVALGVFWAGIIIVALHDRPIFIYLLDAYGYFTPGIATMFLLGIFWKRTTHAGAVTAGLLSIPLSVAMPAALRWLFPNIPALSNMPFFNRTGIVFWLCMLVCVLVSLYTKPKPAAELEGMIWNRQSLFLPTEQRKLYRGLRRPFLWWAIITAVVLYFFVRYR